MQLEDKYYKILKWFVAIVMPAVTACVGTIGQAVGWTDTDLCITIMTAVNTCLGLILGVSTKNYNNGGGE